MQKMKQGGADGPVIMLDKRRASAVPQLPIAQASGAPQGDGAGAFAPLIFNCWYVIAVSDKVDRTLQTVKALGEPLVYYRREDGSPVVLDDRCAHRRYPLSQGMLKGDAIQCGYHGFTYEASGQCIWAPGVAMSEGQEAKLPFGVRAYPCAERGPWLWVWMGDPELADPKDIPMPEVDLKSDATVYGYKMDPSNYMLVIENLLDLSHLHFLHKAMDLSHVAVVPPESAAPVNGVAYKKVVEQTETGIIGAEFGEDPTRRVRLEDEVIQVGPSLNYGYQRREPIPGDDTPALPAVLTIVHALTPIDYENTHQFFMMSGSHPFARDPSEFLYAVQEIVFEQDVEALRVMQKYIQDDVRPGRVEYSMAYDRLGLKMRKILNAMKQKELEIEQLTSS